MCHAYDLSHLLHRSFRSSLTRSAQRTLSVVLNECVRGQYPLTDSSRDGRPGSPRPCAGRSSSSLSRLMGELPHSDHERPLARHRPSSCHLFQLPKRAESEHERLHSSLQFQLSFCPFPQALERVSSTQRAVLAAELEPGLLTCVRSPNASHVIQKLLSLPALSLDFVSAIRGQGQSSSTLVVIPRVR